MSTMQQSVETSHKIHLQDISCTQSCELLEAFYRKQGYFVESKNRFELDFTQVSVTASVQLPLLGCGGNPRQPGFQGRGSGHAKSLRSALNLGVISSLDTMEIEENTLIQTLKSILESGIISPYRLGRALFWNKKERGISIDSNTLIIRCD